MDNELVQLFIDLFQATLDLVSSILLFFFPGPPVV
jgi:hypothetical protein